MEGDHTLPACISSRVKGCENESVILALALCRLAAWHGGSTDLDSRKSSGMNSKDSPSGADFVEYLMPWALRMYICRNKYKWLPLGQLTLMLRSYT